MPEPRSPMKEYRSLDAKRATEGLSPEEESRWAELRDLVGADAGAAPGRGGFDVNAAAAKLRDSLLPAGLRSRPPPVPTEAAPDAFAPAGPLASPHAPARTSRLDPAQLFDAESTGLDLEAGSQPDAASAHDPTAAAAWGPNAPYDPNAATGFDPNAPYDPNAAAGFDPNAPYDPNAAAAYDPNAPYDPNAAAAYDPNASYDPSAAATYDPNASYDPNAAAGFDPNAPYDPNAAAGFDPNASYDPNAAASWDPNAPGDPGASASWDPNAPYDPNAAASWDPNAPYDPNAAASWDPSASYDPGAPASWDPNAPHDPGAPASFDSSPAGDASAGERAWDPNAPAEGGTYDADGPRPEAFPSDAAALDIAADSAGEPAARLDQGWDAAAPIAEVGAYPAVPAAPGWDAGADPLVEPTGAAASHGDAGALPPDGWNADPSPAAPGPVLPLGEYDETGATVAPPPDADAGLSSLPSLEPSSGGAVAEGIPTDFGTAPGEYDDTAGFSAAHPDATPADLPPDADGSGFHAAQEVSGLGSEEWQPDAAVLDDGFSLASGGSFDSSASAAPEWASPAAAPWDASEAPAAATAAGPAPESALEAEPTAAAPGGVASPAATASALELESFEPLSSEAASNAEPTLPPAGAFSADAAATAEPALPPGDAFSAEAAVFAAAGALAGPADGFPAAPAPEPPALEDADLELPAAADTVRAPPDAPPDAVGSDDFAVDVDVTADAPAQEPQLDFSRPDLSAGLDDTVQIAASELESVDVSIDEPGAAPLAEAPVRAANGEVASTLPGREVAAAPPLDLAAPEPDGDDLPTIEGEDILEELPPEGASPAPALDLGALVPSSEPVAPAAAPKAAAPAPPAALAPPAPPGPAPTAAPAPVAPLPALAAAAPPGPPPAPPAPPLPDCHVAGVRRVVIHTVEGQVKRGVLENADLDAPSLDLAPQPGSPSEAVDTAAVKAIFFMLDAGEKAPSAEGKRVRVTFRDGRQVAGYSPDYREDGVGFFMVPADTRTNTGRIWVYRAAVRQVSVS